MPEKRTLERAQKDRRTGKAPSTQAGEFVREEVEHVRKGKHGVRSPKQAIAIGLSKARKAGVDIPKNPNAKKKGAKSVTRKASSETPRRRARASLKALRREATSAVSPAAMGKQAHESAVRRGPKKRHQASVKAARTRQAHA